MAIMRFIKFNYLNSECFLFCLDDLVSMDSVEEETRIGLRNDRITILPIEIDRLCSIIFSDLHEEREYQLIEIDEREKPNLDDFNITNLVA